MGKLLATIHKELLLLWRDKAGLMVLFIMPAVLVVVMSLVQENILKIMGETGTRVLVVDLDQNQLGKNIEEKLEAAGTLEIIKKIDGRHIDPEAAIAAINRGSYQFGIIIPKGFTQAVGKRTRQLTYESLAMPGATSAKKVDIPDLVVYFDPAVRGTFRSAVLNALNNVVLGMEVNQKIKAFSDILPEKINKDMEETLGPLASEGLIDPLPQIKLDIGENRLVKITENSTSRRAFQRTPTSVQQNVPAWALFGIFFIVIPMAGALIKERQDGTLSRLLTMPVSYLTLIAGKVAAYVMVCLAQFGLILLIGKFLLPMLGTPQLTLGDDKLALLIVALSAILAATGYGIMLGTISRTYEQASMFGPISIVIAAAIGGIMVPVYAMPKLMQNLSAFSPLEWGLGAFLDILVRGEDLKTVLPDVLSMLLLFAVMMTVSWIFFFSRKRNGI